MSVGTVCLRPTPMPADNRPISGEGPSKQAVGNMNAAFHQQFSNASAGNSLPAHFDQGRHFHFETLLPTELFEYFHVARLTISKAKVWSHMDGHSMQWPDQNVPHELQGGKVSQFAVEGKNDKHVNAAGFDEPGFPGKGCEEFWSVGRGKKLDGMRLKGDGCSYRADGTGNFHNPVKQLPVRQMDSIEVADRYDACGGQMTRFVKIVNDTHSQSRSREVEKSKS